MTKLPNAVNCAAPSAERPATPRIARGMWPTATNLDYFKNYAKLGHGLWRLVNADLVWHRMEVLRMPQLTWSITAAGREADDQAQDAAAKA